MSLTPLPPSLPHLHVMMIVFSPSQEGFSAIIRECVVTSCGESWGSSLGCVWTQPSGSMSWGVGDNKKRESLQQSKQETSMYMWTIQLLHKVTLCAGYIWPILGLISGTHTLFMIPYLQVFMWRQLVWKVNHLWGIQQQLATSNSWLLVSSSCIGIRIGSGTDLVSSPLRHHDDAPDLLHLRVVGRADSIQVACNLQDEG